MKRWILAISAIFLLTSCGTIGKIQDGVDNGNRILKWTTTKIDELKKTEESLKEKISVVKETTDKKIADLKDEFGEKLEEVEQVTGKFDQDGDGYVSGTEVKNIIVETAQDAIHDPKKRKLLFSWEFWLAIIGSFFGLEGAKKGGAPLAKKATAAFHKLGRKNLADTDA